MDFSQKVSISDTVCSQGVDGEMVLLDLESENYFGLDAVAGDIWKLLKEGETLQSAYDRLLNMYDVQPEQLRSDMVQFVDQLIECKLAVLSD